MKPKTNKQDTKSKLMPASFNSNSSPASRKGEIEKDIDYLEEKFPKGRTAYRGEAIVLLTLAREQGQKSKEKEMLNDEIKLLEELLKCNTNLCHICYLNIKERLQELKGAEE